MPHLLNQSEAAELCRLSARTFERYRATGDGPKYIKAGRRVLYRQADIEAWITACVRTSTSDTGRAA